MKFCSTTGADVQLGLTTGHMAVVTPAGVELDPRFHKEAIANGCMPAGMTDDEPADPDAKTFDRAQVIKDALNGMLAGSNPEDFTTAGKPNLKRVQALIGFNADRSEVDVIWDAISAEAAK
jgi:hypothetical protein